MKSVFWLTILGVLLPYTLFAQMAVISNENGYATIRVNPSLSAEIISPLQNNTVVLIDGIYKDEHTKTEWQKVYFGADPYCLRCTPDFSEGYISGFIHSSDLKNIKELKLVDSDIIKMEYIIKPFTNKNKEIVYLDGSNAIKYINLSAYFGSDCGTPKTEITEINATVKDRVFSIPLDFVWNIIHAQNNFQYFQSNGDYFVFQEIGDGACSTNVVWVFDKNGLKQRLLGSSF